jgi:hypothetical protein
MLAAAETLLAFGVIGWTLLGLFVTPAQPRVRADEAKRD